MLRWQRSVAKSMRVETAGDSPSMNSCSLQSSGREELKPRIGPLPSFMRLGRAISLQFSKIQYRSFYFKSYRGRNDARLCLKKLSG